MRRGPYVRGSEGSPSPRGRPRRARGSGPPGPPGLVEDGGRHGGCRSEDALAGRPVAFVDQTSRSQDEFASDDDDDDDDNNNHNDRNNNNNGDSNDDDVCSLESVDLSSCDVEDDAKVPDEVFLSNQSIQLLKSERIPVPEEAAGKNKNDSVVDLEHEDAVCDVVAKVDAFNPGLQRHQRSLSLDNKVCNLSSSVGNPEIGSTAIPRCTEDDSPVFVESNVRRQSCRHDDDLGNENNSNRNRRVSVFDDLLFDIYNRWHSVWRGSLDSDTFTDMTESDAPFLERHDWNPNEADCSKRHLNFSLLKAKDIRELEHMISDTNHRVNQMSAHLVRQLKCRERRLAALREKYDIVTAILHASSLKRRIDSKIRFSIEPFPGDDAFGQWKDAMKAIARLPLGIPPEFRKNVWLALADNYLSGLCIDWEKTKRLAFNEKSNPDDSKLGLQIVKDLHRTGCSGFNGQDNEEDRAVLKRVLLAYARWNKLVGYCQGFNILAALILDVVDRKEDCALKVMIYLIDRVLPESYFANNLRALSVDMAVFRDLLRTHLMPLSKHLDRLQNAARDQTTGASYEPPLTNVFTMQWFLTLFATCLPKAVALRVWDSVLLEGSEILLRTGIAIWGTLESRILSIQSADEFYSSMGVLSQEMLDGKIVTADDLMKDIYSLAEFPFPQLTELREKYTYNITPFTASLNSGRHQQPTAKQSSAGAIFVDDEDLDEDELIENINCFAGFFLPQNMSPSTNMSNDTESSSDVSKASPGAYAATPVDIAINLPAFSDRVTLDINMLHKQYKRLKQRQKQAHIILATANARQKQSQAVRTGGQDPRTLAPIAEPTGGPTAVNHLFVSRQMMNGRNRNGRGSPKGSVAADNFHGRSSLSIPQQASNLTRTGQRRADVRTPIRPPHNHLGKAAVESSSFDVGSRPGSVASVNGSDDGSVGCDSGSCASTQSDRSCGSSGTAREVLEHRTRQPSLNASECVGSETPSAAAFESRSELEDTLRVRPSAIAATLATLEAAGHCYVHGNNVLEKGDSALAVNMSQPKKDFCTSTTQAENVEIRLQELKVDCQPVPRMDSSRNSPVGTTPSGNAGPKEELQKSSGNKTSKDCGEVPVESSANMQVDLKGNSSSDDVVRVFNPFPKQYMLPRKTRSNVRLGLYSDANAERIGGGQTKRSSEQLQRTAYLQRQYMMQMTKQSKVNKS